MDTATKTFIRELLAKCRDAEDCARWMARNLRIGSRGECRALIAAALEGGEG